MGGAGPVRQGWFTVSLGFIGQTDEKGLCLPFKRVEGMETSRMTHSWTDRHKDTDSVICWHLSFCQSLMFLSLLLL